MPKQDDLSPDAAEAVKKLREQELRDFRAYLTCHRLASCCPLVRRPCATTSWPGRSRVSSLAGDDVY